MSKRLFSWVNKGYVKVTLPQTCSFYLVTIVLFAISYITWYNSWAICLRNYTPTSHNSLNTVSLFANYRNHFSDDALHRPFPYPFVENKWLCKLTPHYMLHTCIHFRNKVSRELHQSVNEKESGPWEHRRQFCELHTNNWKRKFSADSYLSWIVRGWIWYTQAYQCIAQYEGSSKSSHSYRSLATAAGHLLNSGRAWLHADLLLSSSSLIMDASE